NVAPLKVRKTTMSFKLLPKSTEEFSDTKFWEGFFKTRGSKAFEWYGEYQDMVELWAQYVKTGDRVLNIGCGNSNLGAELHDYQNCEVLCIDTSSTVVQQMSRKHSKRPKLSYRVMDAANLEGLDDGSFACAVDKGTLDALMSAADSSIQAVVDGMLAEAHRVLRVGGRHLIVSLCQKQVVDKLVQHISLRPWIARVHQVASTSASDSSGFPLPVFFIALTKLRPAATATAVSSIVQVQDAYSTGPPERLDSVASLTDWIRQVQLTAYSLSRSSGMEINSTDAFGDADSQCRVTQFSYSCGRTGLPTFTCHLLTHVATSSRRRTGYAVFIEPLGSSACRLSPSDRRDLLESQSNLRRLLFVKLHPWLHYQSDTALQASLSRLVMAFAPKPGMPESQVPFLSTGRLAYPYQSVATRVGYIVEQSEDDSQTKELRLLRPESDLSPLLCCANAALVKSVSSTVCSDIVAEAGNSPLGRLLDQLIGISSDTNPCALINWPCNLDWLLTYKHRQPERPPPKLYVSASSPAVSLLAEYFNLTWTATKQPFALDSRHRLVVLFPPADSLASYAAAVTPESIASLASAIESDGCLLLATRLFDSKQQVSNINAGAVDSLRQCSQFVDVICAAFSDEDVNVEQVEIDESAEHRCRWWIACALMSIESKSLIEDFLAGLPGCQLIKA
ncbi:hypothetical protein BOX15_Mlig003755g7, partial [Macrostomum lignano]